MDKRPESKREGVYIKMAKKKPCYVVILKPKVKNLMTRVLSPLKSRVCWNEKRAMRESNHFKKTAKFSHKGSLSMPFSASEIYSFRVVSKSKAKKKGYM